LAVILWAAGVHLALAASTTFDGLSYDAGDVEAAEGGDGPGSDGGASSFCATGVDAEVLYCNDAGRLLAQMIALGVDEIMRGAGARREGAAAKIVDRRAGPSCTATRGKFYSWSARHAPARSTTPAMAPLRGAGAASRSSSRRMASRNASS
jgi:hypothetical protein